MVSDDAESPMSRGVLVKGYTSPLLLPHLFESIGNIKRAELFVVLKLEELVPAMPGHIDEYVRPVIRQKAFRSRHGGVNTT